jgi:hypothetical protein
VALPVDVLKFKKATVSEYIEVFNDCGVTGKVVIDIALDCADVPVLFVAVIVNE